MATKITPPPQDASPWKQKRTPKANLPRAIVAPFKLDHSNAKQFDHIAASIGSPRVRLRNVPDDQVLDGGAAEVPPRRASRRLSLPEKRKQLAKIRESRRTINVLLAAEAQTPPVKGSPLPNGTLVVAGHPPTKKQKLAKGNEPKLEIKPQPLRRTLSRGNSTEGPLNKGWEDLEDGVSPRPKARLPTAVTPMVLRRRTMMVKTKSTEEQELEKIKQMQQEVVEQRRKNETFRAAIAGTGEPIRKQRSVSSPVNVLFQTDDTLGRRAMSKVKDSKEVTFAAVHRRPSVSSPAPLPKGGHTVPKPFKLSKGNKRKLEEESESGKFVSTAQQVEAFFKRTPCRYHLRSRQKLIAGPSPVKCGKPKVTTPQTPQLETKKRHRPVTCKSTAELEAEELAKLQQYKFRARELDRGILEGVPILPKKPVKEPTKPIGFSFHLEKRIQDRGMTRLEAEEEIFTFHSRPCPTKILEGVVGVPEKKCVLPTVPKSPGFALKYRVREFPHEEQEDVLVIKANPMPNFGEPFKPKVPEQKQVELVPFSFDSRDKARLARKAKKLDLRKIPMFKASLLPYFDQVVLPEKKVKPITLPEPFNLQIEERGAKKIQQWKQKMEEEMKQQKEATRFKARPSTVLHQEPFVPKRDNRILSVQDNFELATEKRAKERQEFEKRMAELEAIKEQLEEEDRVRKEEQEKEELARMRKYDLVHKAQPVKKYRTVKTRELPRTDFKSPNFLRSLQMLTTDS